MWLLPVPTGGDNALRLTDVMTSRNYSWPAQQPTPAGTILNTLRPGDVYMRLWIAPSGTNSVWHIQKKITTLSFNMRALRLNIEHNIPICAIRCPEAEIYTRLLLAKTVCITVKSISLRERWYTLNSNIVGKIQSIYHAIIVLWKLKK